MNPNLARLLITLGTSLIIVSPLILPQVRATIRERLQGPPQKRPELEAQSAAHLADLQARVANLLLACEHLLNGETPEETIMYRLIEAHGGMADPVRELRVTEWLKRSQLALANVFAIRRALIDPDIQAERPLPTLIRDWETLYITIVGSDPRILNLTDKELHILLDPIEVLERNTPSDPDLAQQLNHIHDALQKRPLKINLRAADPANYDRQGILGYIDLVEQELAAVQVESTQAAEQQQAQESHNQEMSRKARLTHVPDQQNIPTSGRRLTISERIAAIQAQADDVADDMV